MFGPSSTNRDYNGSCSTWRSSILRAMELCEDKLNQLGGSRPPQVLEANRFGYSRNIRVIKSGGQNVLLLCKQCPFLPSSTGRRLRFRVLAVQRKISRSPELLVRLCDRRRHLLAPLFLTRVEGVLGPCSGWHIVLESTLVRMLAREPPDPLRCDRTCRKL